jgi:electron transfer flavoprotein alpha subunit
MNGVLVILERRGAGWNRMSWEALAAGAQLARRTDEPLRCGVIGSAEGLTPFGATKAYTVQHELLQQYTPDGYTIALEQLIREIDPSYVVFPHTYQVRDFGPGLAARFGETLIADVVGFGPHVFVRQLLQGKLSADYRHTGRGPCFVSVQSGAFRADGFASGSCEIAVFTPRLEAAQIRTRPEEPFRTSAQTVDLASAPLIVSVGRGIKEQDNIPIVQELATALGAELAASRPICDNGWLPMERQVGSSGQTVSPKLYLAVGISGAIQHLVGMKGSKTVIAINKDRDAPIFEVADYGVVGDLFEVVPALTAEVKKAKSA